MSTKEVPHGLEVLAIVAVVCGVGSGIGKWISNHEREINQAITQIFQFLLVAGFSALAIYLTYKGVSMFWSWMDKVNVAMGDFRLFENKQKEKVSELFSDFRRHHVFILDLERQVEELIKFTGLAKHKAEQAKLKEALAAVGAANKKASSLDSISVGADGISEDERMEAEYEANSEGSEASESY